MDRTVAEDAIRNKHYPITDMAGMHLKRWITGLIALPLLLLIIYKGGVYLLLLVSAGSVLALREYFLIVSKGAVKITSALPLVAMLTGLALIWTAHNRQTELIIVVIAMNLVVSGLVAIAQFRRDQNVLEVLKDQIQGVVYVPLFLACLILIRNGENGMQWVFILLGVVFAGDTCALYAGTFWGRHKLAPTVSPGKTVEGSIGGLAAAVMVGSAIKAVFLPDLAWITTVLFCLSVGIAAQVGDLFESVLKRASGVKDSGTLLPGHGGILDRIDALLFAGPVAYCWIEFIF